MANKQQIQECIDGCTQAANKLRTATNSLIDAAERESSTMGAAHIEMCISCCVQAKNIT